MILEFVKEFVKHTPSDIFLTGVFKVKFWSSVISNQSSGKIYDSCLPAGRYDLRMGNFLLIS